MNIILKFTYKLFYSFYEHYQMKGSSVNDSEVHLFVCFAPIKVPCRVQNPKRRVFLRCTAQLIQVLSESHFSFKLFLAL